MTSAARHVEFHARAGEGDALAAVLLEVAESLRGTAGLEQWVVARKAPDVVVVDERWSDAETMRAAAAASHDDPLLPRVQALLAADRPPELTELEPLGGVGMLPAARPGVSHQALAAAEDQGVAFGLGGITEARFPREELGLERTGFALFRLAPGARFPFGHRHAEAEETYVVIAGSGRAKLDDDVRALADRDVLRVGPTIWRSFEAGEDGMELLAFGPRHAGDGELAPGWWTD